MGTTALTIRDSVNDSLMLCCLPGVVIRQGDCTSDSCRQCWYSVCVVLTLYGCMAEELHC
jgi:hypothetical protein